MLGDSAFGSWCCFVTGADGAVQDDLTFDEPHDRIPSSKRAFRYETLG
jgi:hypothetical protein